MKTTEFPHRKIWRITYPVLISLLMEHLIGMTDTAPPTAVTVSV